VSDFHCCFAQALSTVTRILVRTILAVWIQLTMSDVSVIMDSERMLTESASVRSSVCYIKPLS